MSGSLVVLCPESAFSGGLEHVSTDSQAASGALLRCCSSRVQLCTFKQVVLSFLVSLEDRLEEIAFRGKK